MGSFLRNVPQTTCSRLPLPLPLWLSPSPLAPPLTAPPPLTALDAEEEARTLFLRLDPLGQFEGGVSEDQFVEALLVNQAGPSRSVKRTSSRLKRAKPD